MPTRRIVLSLVTGALVVGAGSAGYHVIVRQAAKLEEQSSEQQRLEATVRGAEATLAGLREEHAALTAAMEKIRRELAAAEAAPARLWAHRVKLLRRLFDELPKERIPELELLTPVDWVDVARTAELDSADNIRTALAKLRALARAAFARRLQEALRAYTSASAGTLPSDTAQLVSHLNAPAAAAMLQRYAMTRGGTLGAADEVLIKEQPGADAVLSVALQSWHIHASSTLHDLPAENLTAAFDRIRATAHVVSPETSAVVSSMQAMAEISSSYFSRLDEKQLAGIGDEIKGAVARYRAAHDGEAPADFAQLLPHFRGAEMLTPLLRPLHAELDYFAREGRRPPDAEALRPYLEKPFDPAPLLRAVKLSYEGEKVTTTWSWNSESTETATTAK